MFSSEHLHIAGRLTIQQYTSAGVLIEQISAHNDITVAGRTLVARLFNREKQGDVIQRVSTIQLGGSKAAFNPAHTSLVQPIGTTKIARIEQLEVTDSANKPRIMLRLTGELGERDCNGELREAGLFTEDGVMYNRVIFDTITKSEQFKLTLIWEITF